MNARVLLTAAALLLAAPAVATASPVDQPNDPDFAGQWDIKGPAEGLPTGAPLAHDPENSSGVNFTGAWRQGNVGRPDVIVAYIEGGVNYSSDGIKDALNNVFLNQPEMPKPMGADSYDANGDGHFDLRDYENDPRVNPACPEGTEPFVKHEEGTTRGCVAGGRHEYLNSVNIAGAKTPYLSPEDLIVGLSDGVDGDGNGYVDDISGWNFDRNTNDPQGEDTAYGHAPGLIGDIAGVADNGYKSVGQCRECRVVPIRQGAECLGRPDKWGESILYATDIGAMAISSVVVSYAYSSFNQQAIDYAYDHGVALSLDSNDFDSMDHTDGMLFNHVVPGNSLASDQNTTAGQEPLTTWYRARSSVTSYGTHNVFSGYGTSTSGATPFMASMLAMVHSAGLNARDKGVIPSALSPNEVKQVMMNASSAVIPQTQSPQTLRQWPGNPNSATDATHTNWSTQYGYGRPDIGKATELVMAGKIPPTVDLTSPKWFAYVDPKRKHGTLAVEGTVAASRVGSQGVSWVLEYALGADPADADFAEVSKGTGAATGNLGTIDLSKIPESFYAKAPGTTLQPEGAEQFTLSIRLRAVDGNGLKGEDRRSVGVRHDPDLVNLAPRNFGAEISGAPTYADLEGRHEQDLVFSTYDGKVFALRPDGSTIPGFPAKSDTMAAIDPHNPQNFDARAYREHPEFRGMRDPISGIAIGDLTGDGTLEIAATGMNGRVYAWDSTGHRVAGFPKAMDTPAAQYDVPTPRTKTAHSRLPQRGAWAYPTLAPLEGGKELDILIPGWDSKVYAWRPDGTRVPGWPVEITLPEPMFARDGVDPAKYMRDPKLMYSVGVADVLKTGKPQVFVSSFDCSGGDTAEQDLATNLATGMGTTGSKAWLYGVHPDGNEHPGGPFLAGWPAALPALAFCYDQSIDFVGEGVAAPLFADVDGSGLKILSSAVTGPVVALNPDGSQFKRMDASCTGVACTANPPYRPTGDTHTITLTGQGAMGDLLGTGKPNFIQSTTGIESILLGLGDAGQASLPQVYEKAWNVATGQLASPGFPQRQDGFPFYDAPIVADLGQAGPGTRSAVEANDNYWVHAWGPTGAEAPGFPKYTGQWVGFVGTVGDPRMDGKQHLVYGTREGDLFDWAVQGDPARSDWWHYRHDERNTGQYGLDTRRPATPSGARAQRRGSRVTVTLRAPGDDLASGRAKRYVVRWKGGKAKNLPAPARAGKRQRLEMAVPRRVRRVRVQAIDDAGNVSAPAVLRIR
jgi:hypothetical protein